RTNATRFMMTLLLVGGMRTAGCGRDSEIVGAKTTPPAGARPRSRTAVYGQRPLVWGQIVVYGQSPGRERPQRGTKRHERDQLGLAGPLASGSGRGASFSWIFVPLCGRSLWTLIATSVSAFLGADTASFAGRPGGVAGWGARGAWPPRTFSGREHAGNA